MTIDEELDALMSGYPHHPDTVRAIARNALIIALQGGVSSEQLRFGARHVDGATAPLHDFILSFLSEEQRAQHAPILEFTKLLRAAGLSSSNSTRLSGLLISGAIDRHNGDVVKLAGHVVQRVKGGEDVAEAIRLA